MTLGKVPSYFGHGLHRRALLLRHSPLKWTLASAYPPKPLLFDIGAPASVLASELSEEITVPWCKVGGCLKGRREHRVLSFSIRVSSQSPSFYTLRDRGLSYARAEWETVEVSNYRAGTWKLSQYRSLEQRLKTVEHIEKLSRYRTIEQGLQNCCNIGHSSKVILY